MYGTLNLKGELIRIRGTVQGVGFRPWVWKLAGTFRMRGSVCNDAQGVLIEAWADAETLDRFVEMLAQDAPPLSRVESIERLPVAAGKAMPEGFSIGRSEAGEACTAVASDAATCADCLAEIFSPEDRRYGYPFTNCTHCGPRLSILREIPYDRVNTSMAAFPMCPHCQAEYDDPSDRRFHAQPNACPVCGPSLWLEDGKGKRLAEGASAIHTVAALIREGRIVAIKGIGGIHLACDAANEAAVAELRRRKRRSHKSFALMARDFAMIDRHGAIVQAAKTALSESAAPIVILDAQREVLAPGISPGQNSLGFMLPYTPLHHLLMALLDNPIVLTSGNLSDEPQCIANDEAREKLGGIADFLLLHDREIVTRLDDSVMRVADGRPRMLRRARGYAPNPTALPPGFENRQKILAMGAELKNTFCLLADGQAVLSQHLGDLENASIFREYQRMLEHYQRLYDFEPDLIVVDRHPDYLSTQLGRQLAEEKGLPLLEVQHHHAHMAACMAEHRLPAGSAPVLGLILDGLGYGDDGSIWGGEFLLGGYRDCRRVASFQPIPMLGAAQAMRQPWRNTFAHISSTLEWEQVAKEYADLDIIRFLKDKPVDILQTMAQKGLNSPLASSAGRLFDAVAAAVGICRESVSFEGQAAIELEAIASEHFASQRDFAYGFELRDDSLRWHPLWAALLEDLGSGLAPGVIAARFHHALAAAVAETASLLCRRHGLRTVVLGGGVFQNCLLLEQVSFLLRHQGLRVLSPAEIPAGDGGLALGQAVIACRIASGQRQPCHDFVKSELTWLCENHASGKNGAEERA